MKRKANMTNDNGGNQKDYTRTEKEDSNRRGPSNEPNTDGATGRVYREDDEETIQQHPRATTIPQKYGSKHR